MEGIDPELARLPKPKRRVPGFTGLTDKQWAFVTAMVSGLSAPEAYKKVYSARDGTDPDAMWRIQNGYKLARNPKIRAQVEKLTVEANLAAARNAAVGMAKAVAVDRQWVIKNLKEVVERCMQQEPVRDKDGKPTGEWRFDSRGANQALSLLGKEIGMFVERKEIRHGPLTDATDDELKRETSKLLGELSSLTGKSPDQLLEDLMRNEAAIDVTPVQTAEVLEFRPGKTE